MHSQISSTRDQRILPQAARTSGVATRVRRRPSPKLAAGGNARGWSLGIGVLVVYLFVVHSYKLNVGTIAIAVGLFTVAAHERPLRLSVPLYWYAAYLAWALINIPGSVSQSTSYDSLVDAFKVWLITFLALNVVRTPRQYRLISLAWLGMFALYPVRGTLFNFLTGQGEFGRYGWNFVFKNFNDMATLTLIPLALSIDRLRTTDKKWVHACALAGVVTLPFIILITGSRGGLLGLGAMLMFLLARSRYRSRIAIAVAGVGVIAAVFAPANVWDRIQRMSYLTSSQTLDQSDSSAEQRYLIWQVAEAIIADNPVRGVGLGAYSMVHQEYARRNPEWSFAGGARDTHSTYLRVLAETGPIGLALFLMIFISAAMALRKASKRLKDSELPNDKRNRDRFQAFQAALIGLSVCSIFGSYNTVVFPFLFVAMSTVAISFTIPASVGRSLRNVGRAPRGVLAEPVSVMTNS